MSLRRLHQMSVEGGGDVDVELDGSVVALDVLFNLGNPDVGQIAGVEFGMTSEGVDSSLGGPPSE